LLNLEGWLASLLLAAVASIAMGCQSKNGASPIPAGERIVKRGEPEVVFRDAAGRVLTVEDLRTAEGQVRWEIPGDTVPQAAMALHERGRRLGGEGKYEEAVRALENAAKLAPSWPYPVYDLAFTLLLMGRQEEALSTYERVDQLAPHGFFTTKTALWTLRSEKAGSLPRGTYLAYLKIEWAEQKEEKRRIALALVEQHPDFAPGWKEVAVNEPKPSERLQAVEKGLASKPDPETFTVLVINKAIALNALDRRDEAIKLLGTLVLNPPADATTATVPQAKAALALIAGGRGR